MLRLNTKTLFFLFLLNTFLAGICFTKIDWIVFEMGTGIYDEISLACIFTGLSFFFLIPYVKKLKEKRKTDCSDK